MRRKKVITSEEIKHRLWNGANDLRGSIDASKYKDYMLGLMFYKFLSDKTLDSFAKITSLSADMDVLEEYKIAHEKYGSKLGGMIQDALGYYILPSYLYQNWERDIQAGNFELQKVMDSLNHFERTIAVTQDSDDFKGIFSNSIVDFTDTALGSDVTKRSKNIRDLIRLFSDLNTINLQNADVLGDAYEYLIGMFASNAGKKAGEFYTPRQVSEIMAQIVVRTATISSIYDPTVGSGSLLLTVRKHLSKENQKDLDYYGQEYLTETYNLTRMNLLLHGIRPEKMHIKNGNTLAEDWPKNPKHPSKTMHFDAVVMNPPYSDKKWNQREETPLKVNDPRFADLGVLPPDTRGDFAYLMHGLYHLGDKGTMAIVLPHGVLFRGSSEGDIRKYLLKENYIDAIIGLPSNLFTNTSIPVVVLILKKNRDVLDPVQIIDASNSFLKSGKQSILQEKDIAKIVDTYVEKLAIKGYSYLASRDEIVANDYNMNIARYVEPIDNMVTQDVDAHLYGGIPEHNIYDLRVLQSTVKDILDQTLEPLRPGYVMLNQSVAELTKQILSDSRIITKSVELKKSVTAYITNYWKQLHQVKEVTGLMALKEQMLVDIKMLLKPYEEIDPYAGYHVVSEIWENMLKHDIEIIANLGFYNAGRTRNPNIVVKGLGNKKHKEQDGWIGAIIPNDLIAKRLYDKELNLINSLKSQAVKLEGELSELIEASKYEDSDEHTILYGTLKKNSDDEIKDAFENRKVRSALKTSEKGSKEEVVLKNTYKLLTEKTKINKVIKIKEIELKEAIFNRLSCLTDEEIDQLVFEKWFGDITNKLISLVEEPLKEELSRLDMLNNRYSSTLSDIEFEITKMESDFESLLTELVVTI